MNSFFVLVQFSTLVFWSSLLLHVPNAAGSNRAFTAEYEEPSRSLPEVDSLNARGYEVVFNDPAHARLYFDSAIELASKSNYNRGLALAFKNKAISFDIQGNANEAIRYFLESLKVYESLDDKLGIARVKNNLGVAYKNLKDFDRANSYYHESVELKKVIGDAKGVAYGYANIGELHLIRKEFGVALPYFERAKMTMDSLQDRQGTSVILSNLGEIYFELGDYQKVISVIHQATEIESEMGNNFDLAQSYNALARTYLKMGKLDSAWFNQKRGEVLATQIGITKVMYQNQLIKIDLYTAANDFKSATSAYQKALALSDSLSKINLAEEIAEIQTKYEFRQKEDMIRTLQNETILSRKLIQSQNSLITYIVIVITLLIAFLLTIFYFYKVIRQKNEKLSDKVFDLKRTQEELKDHEEQLETFFSNGPDAVIILDENGIIADWNPKAEWEFGWKKREIIGKSLFSTMIREIDPRDGGSMIDLFEGKIDVHGSHPLEIEALKHDGELITIALSISKTSIKGSKYFIVFARDISDKKKAEEELIQAKLQAEYANNAKTEFLSNISHEIRTPLNAIIGFSEILKSKIRHADDSVYVDHILNAGQNLLLLISDILDLSKIEAGVLNVKPVTMDIRSFLAEMENFFHVTKEQSGLLFEIDIHPTTPQFIVLDPIRLRQVLYNLLGNAFKFTPSGFVKLSVNVFPDAAGHGDIRFVVEDSGIGIPSEKQSIIFEAFRQLDGQNSRKYGGTGLGLTITRRLIKLMGGGITLRSTVGRGSTFIVSVPYKEPIEVSVS